MPSRHSLRLFGVRIAYALLYGVLIFAVSCIAAWQSTGRNINNNPRLLDTMSRDLREIGAAVESHIEKQKAPPESLQALGFTSRQLRDAWGRPFLYSVTGTSWTVVSYGRDGRPGGDLWEADFYVPGKQPELEQAMLYTYNQKDPTFREFYFQLPTQGVVRGAAALAAFASFLACIALGEPPRQTRNWKRTVISLAVTLLAAWAMAFIMSQMHIPTGH